MWINSEQYLQSKPDRMLPEEREKVKASYIAFKPRKRCMEHVVPEQQLEQYSCWKMPQWFIDEKHWHQHSQKCTWRRELFTICCCTSEVASIHIYGDTVTAETEHKSQDSMLWQTAGLCFLPSLAHKLQATNMRLEGYNESLKRNFCSWSALVHCHRTRCKSRGKLRKKYGEEVI